MSQDLKPTQVATYLGVSRATVHRWTEQGILSPSRVLPSGHRRYSPADVQALREQLEQGARDLLDRLEQKRAM